MRFPTAMLALACTALSGSAVLPMPAHNQIAAVLPSERPASPGRKKRRLALSQAPARYRRSKGAQAKAKRRSNRVTVSRRVRRRHRRAA